MKKLLPCPFCGGSARVRTGRRQNLRFAEIICIKCSAKSLKCFETINNSDVLEKAREAWNRRASMESYARRHMDIEIYTPDAEVTE